MKITAIILLAACLSVSASSRAQISLKESNVPLQQVFKKLEKQSGYDFLYTSEDLSRIGNVSVQVSNVSLRSALDACLKGKPLTYLIMESTVVIRPLEEMVQSQIQRLDISGRITDEKGAPVVARVTVKGTNLSVMTDADGKYTIPNAPANAVLIVSALNIETKEISAEGKSKVDVVVKAKVFQLSEVVLTAYNVEKQAREIGYSTAKITGEELTRANPSNLLTGLAGKVSGLNLSTTSAGINPQTRILLRGLRSFGENTNNLPLVIFNGAPLSFGSDQQSANVMIEFINNINPNDVESINILKGANGAALYGPEGVNGVILITTKKGGLKPQVNFKHSTMLQSIDERYPKLQKQFGSGVFTDTFGNGIYDPFRVASNWGPAFTGELIQIGRPDENGEVQRVPYQYTDERFKFWDIAQTIQNNVSVSQGDAKSDFYLSGGHTYQTGLTPGDKSNRFSLLLNSGRQFGILSTRINMGYTKSTADVFSGNPSVLNFPAHIPITSYKDFRNDKWSDHNHYWADNATNIYEDLATNRSGDNNDAFFGNVNFILQPFKWLKLNNRTGVNYFSRVKKGTREPVYYTEFGRTNGRSVSVGGDRKASVTDEQLLSSTLSNDLLANTQVTKGVFSNKTTLGYSLRSNVANQLKTGATDLLVPVYNIGFSSNLPSTTQIKTKTRSYSLFGSTTFGYKNWAFVEVTARQDWDSKIATAGRDNNYYYGANTSIVLTDALPKLSNNVLSSLRLRASATKTANMNIEPYQSELILRLASVYPDVLSYSLFGAPNPYIRPENVISQEYGLAGSLLRDRIKFDVAYYTQRNNGVIAARSISAFSGAAEIVDNIGDFRNFGWEFDLALNPLLKLGNGLSVNVEGLFSMNDNKVVSLGQKRDDSIVGGGPGGPFIYTGGGRFIIEEGSPAYIYSTADWLRDPQGRVIVDKTTGLPSVDYTNFIKGGRSMAKYMGSFNLHILWKNLGLHMVGEYRGGYKHYFRNGNASVIDGTAEVTAQYGRKRFVFPNSVYDDGTGNYVANTDVAVSSADAEYYNLYAQAESNFLVSGAFWKMREIAVSYDWVPKDKWLKKMTFTLAGRNLFSLYPKTNRWGDPELVTGAGSAVRDDQKAASNLNGIFSEGTLGGSRFYGLSVNATF
ncbi:MAG: SusC/RagA family TonB-linked outer membrane protein [Pedobacter sp.]|nr:SusC/RagA family TonB-linked outer membrane protein [Pedobacter sp.]